jgi:hypothetical protein
MDARLLFLILQHVCQVVLSLYGLRYSFTAITNLQKYEEATKKAAKWSKEAEDQLFKTRMTQGTGIITVHNPHPPDSDHALTGNVQVSLSLVASLTISIARFKLPPWAVYASSPTMLAIVLGARLYIKNFWAPTTDAEGKDVGTKVPLLPSMQDYNLAVEKTEDLLKVLEYLEYSWLLTGFVTFMVHRNLAG